LSEDLTKAVILKQRKLIVNEFETMINNNEAEPKFQSFFKNNPWLLGHAVEYGFLTDIKDKVEVKDSDGEDKTGYNDCDFKGLTQSRHSVLVEIKKPKVELFGKRRNENEQYYPMSLEISQGISQLQYYLHHYPKKKGLNEQSIKEKFNVAYTRGILIIGKKPTDDDELLSFHFFKSDLHSVDILTYDELLERAKQAIGYNSNP
jgi:hypothetical protein